MFVFVNVSDSPYGSSQSVDALLGDEDACDTDVPAFKDVHLQKLGHNSKDFSWLGVAWTCRKRRRHYQSFCRNGITISVHDFVYVLAEENKRLVAYLEDMYVDSRGNKMVVVRWFHKIDEVGIDLPHNFNDREIFFSLCLQDLSIECIDGLATVLSPPHFEKFQNNASNTLLEAFVCHRQVDNDDVKPFDITQVQGYLKQGILKYMYTKSPPRVSVTPDPADGLEVENGDDDVKTRPKKRHCVSKVGDMYQQHNDKKEDRDTVGVDVQKLSKGLVVRSSRAEFCSPKEGGAASLFGKKIIKKKSQQHLAVGSLVEVLSQDSGIRGCWLRAIILKRRKDKVKVQYQDIRDAADEANNLEEWILASKVSLSDELGLRICGRTTVRPHPPTNKCGVSLGFVVGTPVDVWWCDGWWEGIVVLKESEDKLHVYFPGEKRTSIFGRGDLRHSQEWVSDKWKHVNERKDLVTPILSGLESRQDGVKSCDGSSGLVQEVANCDNRQLTNNIHVDSFSREDAKAEFNKSSPRSESRDDRGNEANVVTDLSKDDLLSQLKWKSLKKRRHGRGSLDSKRHCDGSSSSSPEDVGSAWKRFLIPNSMKVDQENCMYRRDSLFTSSIPLSSLVMSR
ncbi:hypothetical protein HHK36_006959 [Tetracentron sinense]|uniref:BAH domain-containing protein n=1 Tax=Tetracentron sinense TaxID=13715 RepID=A0A835DKT5_TETSI|nr:hypothetical protein HHK36_006959 [Tetracentron sinense]